MLKLIGLGLWDEKGFTLRGLEEARECDLLFLENYTSKLMGTDKQRLEELTGKRIQLANREFLENYGVLDYAENNDVGLLVAGDPMVATTHSDLVIEARKRGIKTKVIHNASIFSAIGETGLQLYKLGRSATITFWTEDYKPTSWFDVFKQNKERGLHTLFFLDLDLANNKYLNAQQALKQLIEAGLDEETEVVVGSQIGSPNSRIVYGKAGELMDADVGLPLQVIIIPGKLHPKEEEFLEQLRLGE